MKSRIDNAMRMLNQPSIVDLEDQVIDAVTDLIHLCAQYNLDWERVTDQAEWHYEQEAAEGEQA
jgi:hypothetical protein